MKRPGMTLVELLLYMGITTIAVVVFMNFMTSVSQVAARSGATSEVVQTQRLLVARMVQDIRGASAIISASGNTLSLTVKAATVTYTTSGTSLTRNGSPLNSTTKVSNLTFGRIGNLVTVTLTLTGSTGKPMVTLSDAITPRTLLY